MFILKSNHDIEIGALNNKIIELKRELNKSNEENKMLRSNLEALKGVTEMAKRHSSMLNDIKAVLMRGKNE